MKPERMFVRRPNEPWSLKIFFKETEVALKPEVFCEETEVAMKPENVL